MTKSATNPKVDFRFDKEKHWHEEMKLLRVIVLEGGLVEELKWRQPCYTFENKNIVLIHGFKEYCALLFINGALLKDPKNILIQQTENVQAGRQIRFANLREVTKLKSVLKTYIKEAVEVSKTGLKVVKKKHEEYAIPEELQKKLDTDSHFEAAFFELTPGRQHGYILYFAAPKQSKTREARIEKCTPLIFAGKGLNE